MRTVTKITAAAGTVLLSAGFLAGCGSAATKTSSGSPSSSAASSSTSSSSAAPSSSSSSGSGASTSGGTVTIVSLRATSGPTASLGVPGNNALATAVQSLNAHGGLLGKKVQIKYLNTQASPSQSSTDARQAVLADHAVAMFGGVASADGVYEEGVAKKYKTLLFSYTFNDAVFTRTKDYTPYFFSIVPNTNMEPMAAALVFKQHGWTKIATISPNYNFGHAEVQGFLTALKKLGVHYTLVDQQWPALGAPNFTSNITAIMSKSPQAVYGGIYGSDLETFTKEALGYGFFKRFHFAAQFGSIDIQALGSSTPAGAIGFARGGWWTSKNAQVMAWAKQYKAKYGGWPSSYSMLGTMAFDAWVYGVKKAHSFNSTKVSQALAGATIPTLFENYKIRACDHQAEIGEYIGVLSKKGANTLPYTYNPLYKTGWNQIKQGCPATQ